MATERMTTKNLLRWDIGAKMTSTKKINQRKFTWAQVSLEILFWFRRAKFTNTSANLKWLMAFLGFYRADASLQLWSNPPLSFRIHWSQKGIWYSRGERRLSTDIVCKNFPPQLPSQHINSQSRSKGVNILILVLQWLHALIPLAKALA